MLLRRIDWLVERIQELMRERLHWQWRRDQDLPIASSNTEDGVIVAGTTVSAEPLGTAECTVDDVEAFEASLVTADLVICQTGCLSHDAYWRVQDHCRRTGKACVVMARPDVLRIVRVHASDPAEAPNDRGRQLSEPVWRMSARHPMGQDLLPVGEHRLVQRPLRTASASARTLKGAEPSALLLIVTYTG